MKATRAGVVALLLLGVAWQPLPTPADRKAGFPPGVVLRRYLPGVAPGDVVRRNGLAVTAPVSGQAQFAAAASTSGPRSLAVATDGDGRVALVAARMPHPQDKTEFVGEASSPPSCYDDSYALSGWRQQSFQWRFRSITVPRGLSPARALAAALAAATNITHVRNNCGYSLALPATHTYLGDTIIDAGIEASGACLPRDGYNVVAFGALPSSVLSLTCTQFGWSDPVNGVRYEISESDTKLNTSSYRWTTTPRRRCREEMDVQGVLTHEFGHIFGLDHLDEAYHAYLTMSSDIRSCSNKERTLGLGDILGLRAIYGSTT